MSVAAEIARVLVVVLGPAMGSAAALLADRLPRGEPVGLTRSRCRSCGRVLGARELVPVLSWLWQRGRCAGCGAAIPAWLLQAENLLLFGPSGVGKTHLAIAITMAMVAQDQVCRFSPATALVQLLQKAKAAYDLPAMLQKLDRYALLVIDDISYVRRSELETSVLFELICHRYERKSLLVTSNQPFREWDDIFPSGSMTVAGVDRLVHHCHIIGIKGECYRQKAAAARVSSDQSDPPTSLTRASVPARSPASAAQTSKTRVATRKLAHLSRQSPRAPT